MHLPRQRQSSNAPVALADRGIALLKLAPPDANLLLNAEVEGLQDWIPRDPAQCPPHNRPSVESHTHTFVQLQLQRATELTHDGAQLRNPMDHWCTKSQVVEVVTGHRAKHMRHHPMLPAQHLVLPLGGGGAAKP